MSEGILTSKQDMDGAVIVPPVIRSEDGYNVASSNVEILRLQICKSQVTQELSNDCISMIQQNIVKGDQSSLGIWISVILFVAAALWIGMFVFKKFTE